MKTNFERRAFFKKAIGMTAAMLVTARFGNLIPLANAGKAAALPAGEKQVDEKDPVATAIGLKLTPKKGDAPKGQSCSSCQLFTKVNDGWGHCQMLAGKGVVGSGSWCKSYSKKS